MMRSWPLLIVVLSLVTLPDPAAAQFRGRFGSDGDDSDRRRGDDSDDRRRGWSRDDDDGDRGGESRWDRGRSFGGWGRGDGERSFGRFGGDDGGRSFGSGRGGPPGGFGGPPGGFGGPPGGFRPDPGAMFDRLDRNGDGELGGDEIEGAGFFRGMLERSGVREGSSRDDFTRGFERMREERERGESGSRDDERNRNESSGSSAYKPAERPRVTIDIPDTFRDRDLDGDGQIGLYEWRDWDRSRTDEFFFLDMNGDGFLTPKELAAAAGSSDGGGEAESGSRREFAAGATSSAGSSTGFDENDAEVRRGRQFFGMLDANRDGKVNPDEWSASRRLRPQFEEAGARLDRDMTQDEFVATYLKTAQ